jgi:hypothetical protein
MLPALPSLLLLLLLLLVVVVHSAILLPAIQTFTRF